MVALSGAGAVVRRAALPLTLLTACGGGGVGVNLTIETGQLSASDRGRISQVTLIVGGAESFTKTVDGVPLRSGEAGIHYIPGITIGTLTFHVDASDANLIIASGDSGPVTLDRGHAVPAEIILGPPMPLDMGADGSFLCTTSSQCSDVTPICQAGTCRQCLNSSDDSECKNHNAATPRCGSTGICVACAPATQTMDCTSASPVCDQTGACRRCQLHAECTSDICKADGTCAQSSQIAYVDNLGMATATCKASGTHDGNTPLTAYCDIQDALPGTKPYVLVKGSSVAYNGISMSSGDVVFVGPGLGVNPSAFIMGANNAMNPCVALSGTAKAVIDGFEMSNTNADGVNCSTGGTGASVTLIRNRVHRVNGTGVYTFQCDAVLDQNIIGPSNQSGGINLTQTTYSITNNFIVDNGVGGIGVGFDSSSTGRFAFNTVAQNTFTGLTGGIDCANVNNHIIESSIVWGNSTKNGSQIVGNCVLVNTVTGTDNYAGAIQEDPTFVNLTSMPYDYHLRTPNDAANLACCIDKITMTVDGGAAMLPDHDIDNAHRPKGAGWDIGGHEAQ